MKYYILIDGSYFVFYRMFALVNWWKLSHSDEPQTNLHLNEEFLDKYKSTFVTKLNEIPNKLKLTKEQRKDVVYIIGKDCPRQNIWRHQYIDNYKGTRANYDDDENPTVHPKTFFQLAYNEGLYDQCKYPSYIIKNRGLEADDCLALATKYIRQNTPDDMIYVITSDTDYLQLIQPNVHLYSLKYKPVNTKKNSYGDSKIDLLCKIISGDKSDNIPGLLKKCGKRTLDKIAQNPDIFFDKLHEDDALNVAYLRNKQVIDFDEIPYELQAEFIDKFTQLNIITDDSSILSS